MLNPRVRAILQQNLNWIVIAAFFFGVGIAAAVLFIGNEKLFLGDLTASQHKMLEELAELVFGGSPLRGILFLLINNLMASLQMMLLGVIMGIPPLLGLFTNGALLGSVASLSAERFPVISFILLGILPHGIFELPAFIISAAFGLKVGFHLIFPLSGKKRGESLVTIWREYWSVFPLILNLLILAAIFEVLVTPLFLNQLL
ncbi:MAG: stage II sporulation protein M [Bacillota bacterium]